MRLSPDVKNMSHGERGQEIMRLRTAFSRELKNTGNRRCWVTLFEAFNRRNNPATCHVQRGVADELRKVLHAQYKALFQSRISQCLPELFPGTG